MKIKLNFYKFIIVQNMIVKQIDSSLKLCFRHLERHTIAIKSVPHIY